MLKFCWGEALDEANAKSFDLLLASDCVYVASQVAEGLWPCCRPTIMVWAYGHGAGL